MNLKAIISKDVQTVLFGVLNWGLGHAARSLPIIQALNSQNIQVIVASDGVAGEFLKKELTNNIHLELAPYNVLYKNQKIEYSILTQLPKVLNAIRIEKKDCHALVQQYKPDLIVSDSRFGFRHANVQSIIISHQLNLISNNKLFSVFGNLGNQYLLNQFNACWIPDFTGSKLSGRLSEAKLNIPKIHIGPLSRFSSIGRSQEIDVLIVLSGPEPKRSELVKTIQQYLQLENKHIVGIEGNVEPEQTVSFHNDIRWYNFMGSAELQKHMNKARLVICRSGYSSLMDLAKLNLPAILIPTPGQTEQEYLANQMNGKMGFVCLKEESLAKQLNQTIITCLSRVPS